MNNFIANRIFKPNIDHFLRKLRVLSWTKTFGAACCDQLHDPKPLSFPTHDCFADLAGGLAQSKYTAFLRKPSHDPKGTLQEAYTYTTVAQVLINPFGINQNLSCDCSAFIGFANKCSARKPLG